MNNKRIEIATSIMMLLGLFLPMFASKEQMVGIFSLPGCFGRCPDPGGIMAMVFFIIGWIVLLIDFVRRYLIVYQKLDDSKVLGQMLLWCMLLVFFRVQSTEVMDFGTTYPFVGWWLLVLGIWIKIRLRIEKEDKISRIELRKLFIMLGIILLASMPYWKKTIYPWFGDEPDQVTVRYGLGGMFFGDLFRTNSNGFYIFYPLRQFVFALLIAIPLFVLAKLQMKRLFSKLY